MLRAFKRYKPHQKIKADLMKLENSDTQTSKISISESFKQFMDKTIPAIEKEVEVRILSSMYHKLKNDSIKQELLNAYKRRQLDLHFNLVKPEISVEEKKTSEETESIELNIFSKDLNNVTIEDVDRFYDFPLLEYHYMFPSMNFGHRYHVEKVLSNTMKFAVQMTPEAFKIVKMLEKQSKLRELHFSDLKILHELEICEDLDDLEEAYANRDIYLKLTYSFGDSLREVLKDYRFDEKADQIFTHSFLYDTLINIFVWQMHRKEVRELLYTEESRRNTFKSVIEQILNHPDS